MDLADVRNRIDEVDHKLLDLFCQRMELAAEVAESKIGSGKAVFDPAREREKLLDVARRSPERLQPQAVALFSLLMSMNKAEQQRIIARGTGESRSARAHASLKPVSEPFPATASVACQGVEGAYSQIAACKLFRVPGITFFSTFEGVFRAVREGLCDFGVLPIENSTAGSVNAVYDLLAEYSFSIVRSCSDYLEQLGVTAHELKNTAQAAEFVSRSPRNDIAALSSRDCAALYGLDVLESNVQDSDNNYTRFIVVSAEPQIFPGSTRTSLMLTMKHEPGSLYRVLERFYALDINLVKLESRPIPGRDFEFMFYFDIESPAGTEPLDTLLDSLDDVCESIKYFGSYTEVL